MKFFETSKKKGLKQFIRFCLVGVIGVTFTYSIFFILHYFFNIYYIFSSATGFILGVFLVFFLNKEFTFKVEGGKIKSLIIKYYVVNIFSLLFGMIILAFFVEILRTNVYLSNFLILGITTISNFIGSKFIVFKR